MNNVDEKFKELGYKVKYSIWDNDVQLMGYYQDEVEPDMGDCAILFYRKSKQVSINCLASMEELEAVYMKCQELGWIYKDAESDKTHENLKIATSILTRGVYPADNEVDNDFNKQFIKRSVIEDKIKSLDKRLEYLEGELTEAYIKRDKAGTETEIDSIETYIYNMEQERSIRHTQKYAYKDLL